MKQSTNKKTIALFWSHAKRYPTLTYSLLALLPITIFLHQFLPALISSEILRRLGAGEFNPHDIWGSFGTQLIWYGLAVISGAMIAWRIVIFLLWKTSINVVRDINNRVFNHLLGMSANFHANKFSGSLVSQAGNLVNAYYQFTDSTIFLLMPLATSLGLTAIILLPRTPILVLILFIVSFAYIAVAIITSRRLRDLNAKESDIRNERTGHLADALGNIMAVKSFAATGFEGKRFAAINDKWATSERAVMFATLKRQMQFSGISTSMDVGALMIAVASVVLFEADVATVFLVLTYTGNVLFKLWDFSSSGMRNYNSAFGQAKAMVEILDQKPLVRDPVSPETPAITKGAIEFADVTFAHADSRKDVLFNNLTLHIKAGEKIGLVGHSGSGKTTLTKLLLRFSDIDKGAITIDGQNITHITQDALRQHIAYVPQEPLLFHRTIRENIAYGSPTASLAAITLAAKRANADEFIQKLPKGYNTEVGERGVKLSGGQRQRIAIARAILKDAPILILDEATSALDSESEKLIQSALWELMQNRTAIVIAHRLSTVQRMDRIVVLENGNILEQGTHQQLLGANGTYAGLWAHQSGGFIEE